MSERDDLLALLREFRRHDENEGCVIFANAMLHTFGARKTDKSRSWNTAAPFALEETIGLANCTLAERYPPAGELTPVAAAMIAKGPPIGHPWRDIRGRRLKPMSPEVHQAAVAYLNERIMLLEKTLAVVNNCKKLLRHELREWRDYEKLLAQSNAMEN